MRRTLLALTAGALTLSGLVTAAPASANHNCAEGFEIVCFIGCPNPPKICPWP
ncbi:MAG TPA: hypothetical protein VNA20_14110 [Frankiaceae bacterium]|nr:hypothetical protein [Frankiaceae bacterium]